jgi:ABC-type sugar transport system ATPase subunit
MGMISKVRESQIATEYVNRLGIILHNPLDPVSHLSGGNQQKIMLAKWLAMKPRVLLLDEPTRGVDIGAKHDIYVHLSTLAKGGMALIMASSELPELLSICDRIMVLREGEQSLIISRSDANQEIIMEAAAPV